MLELKQTETDCTLMRSHTPCNNPHLSALKDLRIMFEIGPKHTNTLGKAIYMWSRSVQSSGCTVEHVCDNLYHAITIITQPSAERSGPVLPDQPD